VTVVELEAVMAFATGGPLPPREDDVAPAVIDPGCSYYIPRSHLPETNGLSLIRLLNDREL